MFKRKPKHVHDFAPAETTSVVMTLGAGPMTYVTRRCKTCDQWVTQKLRGEFTPEMLD